MKALDRKLARDLWGMKGQALAISLVVAGGVATFVMSASVFESLLTTQSAYYRESRFAEVFASLKRAPLSLAERIAEIRGVDIAELRVAGAANLELAGYADPLKATVMSVPDTGTPRLNRLFLRRGRTVDSTRDNEAVVNEAFAQAHNLQPGDSLSVTINGRRRRLTIVGIGLSPEFIYLLPPGTIIPDFERFAVLWLARTPLESAYDMEGAFNDVTLSLSRGASVEEVIDRIDILLEPYGGLGAISRADQTSHRYLSEEFKQLRQMSRIFPAIFLGVAAFLLNVVVTRLIATQREQIAILKAFGYSNLRIVVHYIEFVVIVVLAGSLLGTLSGAWLGRGMLSMYEAYYKFPAMLFQLPPRVIVLGAIISVAAAILGTIVSVARAAALPPAEAMQPPPPARYRVSIVERLGLRRLLRQPTRMIVRNIERRPVKALFTVVGAAFACAILVTGLFFSDAVDYMIEIQFKLAQREDVSVSFIEPASHRALYSLSALPAVQHVEPYRAVPVRLRFQHRTYRTSLSGFTGNATLRRLLDTNLKTVELPEEGVVLTDHLAVLLGIRAGDVLTVEVLEGSRPTIQLPIAGLVKEYLGVAAYMRLDALNRAMGEGNAISGAYVLADSRHQQELYDRLDGMPRVAGSAVRLNTLTSFRETMAQQMLTFAFFETILAAVIAIGVIYNSARIAFAERSRELASLRVLGFTRGEIAYILLGEFGILTLASLPVGLALGRALGTFMVTNVQTDLFRVPIVIEPSTYAFAASVVLVSAALSAILIKRQLDQLDLVAVLKTKE